MIIDTNTPKELEHFNQHKGLLINENLLNEALAKHPELTPVVKCEWSEANEFNSGQTYTLKEYDEMMRNADNDFFKERENRLGRNIKMKTIFIIQTIGIISNILYTKRISIH